MRSNVPIALSRRSAYRVCGVTGVAIEIVLEVDAFVCPDCSSIYGPEMLGRSEERTSELQSLRHRVCLLVFACRRYPPDFPTRRSSDVRENLERAHVLRGHG